jgi:hypothetical protein
MIFRTANFCAVVNVSFGTAFSYIHRARSSIRDSRGAGRFMDSWPMRRGRGRVPSAMTPRAIVWRRGKVQGYYGSWLPFLLELYPSAKALAFRFSSRAPVAARPNKNNETKRYEPRIEHHQRQTEAAQWIAQVLGGHQGWSPISAPPRCPPQSDHRALWLLRRTPPQAPRRHSRTGRHHPNPRTASAGELHRPPLGCLRLADSLYRECQAA